MADKSQTYAGKGISGSTGTPRTPRTQALKMGTEAAGFSAGPQLQIDGVHGIPVLPGVGLGGEAYNESKALKAKATTVQPSKEYHQPVKVK